MNNQRSIAALREHLFKQLDLLSDPDAKVDMERARMIAELSQTVINSVKVEVEFAKVMKGAVTLPFIEDQASERPNTPQPALSHEPNDDDFPVPPVTAEERTQRALNSGPAEDHPWRGLGGRVHMLRR